VDIGDGGDLVGEPLGDAGDDHAAIGMADEDEFIELLAAHGVANVLDMGREVDRAAEQMRALAEPGQRRIEHAMAARPHALDERGPAVAAAPGAVDDDESRCLVGHVSLLKIAYQVSDLPFGIHNTSPSWGAS